MSKISSYVTLHLIKVENWKRFSREVLSDLKTTLKTDLAKMQFIEL